MKALQIFELTEEIRKELIYDFRKELGLSYYDGLHGNISLDEFFDLIVMVISTPGTKSRSKFFDIEEFSYETLMLTNVYNAIISSIDTKPSVKKKAYFKLKKPKNRDKNSTPAKKKLTIKDKARLVRIAPVDSGDKDFELISIVELYHIDRNNKIRKCRKDGVDCKANKFDKHFNSKEEAEAFKGV